MERRGRAVASRLLLLTALAACGESGPGAAARDGTVVYCSQANVESLNPFVSPDQGAIDLADLLFTPLVRYDDSGGLEPYLASSWEWAEDGRTLTLRIRDDLTWHDGRPVRAADVGWTILAAADPAYAYWSGADLAGVEEATTSGDTAVVVRFATPPPAGLEPFVTLPILPRHLLAEIEPAELSQQDYNRSPVGSGPFRVVGRQPDGSIAFERYEAFPSDLGRPSIARFLFRPIPETTTLVAELTTGTSDVCLATSLAAEQLGRSEGVEVIPLRPAGVQAIILNTRRPPLDDVRIRRALSAALRRDQIAAALSPVAQPALNFLPPGSPWLDSTLAQPDGRPGLADSLLTAAGWQRRQPGVPRIGPGDQTLTLEIYAPPQFETVLTAVQAQLAAVGIETQLRFMEFASLIPTIMNPDTRPAAMAIGFTSDRLLHPGFYDLLHSEGQQNLASYRDPIADSILVELQSASDRAELRALYGELQRQIVDDVPIIYTLYVPRLLAAGARVRGVEPDLDGPLANIHRWSVGER